MSHLAIYPDNAPDHLKLSTQNANEIQHALAEVGVLFEQWQAQHEITDSMSHEQILNAYEADISRLKTQGGYQTVDVISLPKGTPNAAELRQKFLFEHTHSEDEVRFFVKGEGLFCLHINNKVYQVLCQKGDLISVPELTPHWFDMGDDPEFTAIRLFNNETGWVAESTESDIALKFPKLGE